MPNEPPKIGDTFVWMSAGNDMTSDWTETIADVIAWDGEAWVVEVGLPRRHHIPKCFIERWPTFGEPLMIRHRIVWQDGRWIGLGESERAKME